MEGVSAFVNPSGFALSASDHSLIQFYPGFETHLRDSLRHLVGKQVEEAVEIGLAKDGSGVGGKSTITPSPLDGWRSKRFPAALGALIATKAAQLNV
jgi:hypothetical protein